MRVTARKQERRYFEPNPPITHAPATLSTYADKPQQHGALLIHPQPAAVLRQGNGRQGRGACTREQEKNREKDFMRCSNVPVARESAQSAPPPSRLATPASAPEKSPFPLRCTKKKTEFPMANFYHSHRAQKKLLTLIPSSFARQKTNLLGSNDCVPGTYTFLKSARNANIGFSENSAVNKSRWSVRWTYQL